MEKDLIEIVEKERKREEDEDEGDGGLPSNFFLFIIINKTGTATFEGGNK